MKKIFQYLLFRIIFYSKIHVLSRIFIQKNKVSILLFHECDDSVFEKIILYLKSNYQIISLKSYINKKINLKSKKPYLIITFDDGCVSNFKLLKTTKKHNIPITVYLIHDYLRRSTPFWWNYDNLTLQEIEHLKTISNKDRISIINAKKLRINNIEQRDSLDIKEIAKMNNYFDFQCHTMSHPILTNCDEEEVITELKDSKQKISLILKKDVNHFAYPNGNYDKNIIKYLKLFGYKSAVTVEFGLNQVEVNSFFELKRIIIGDGKDFISSIVCASAVYGYLKKAYFLFK
jgi:peptidoglycan/xylan/chitin deacetylase (PgdA/CDA1 family)